jgi:hypothetical protein
MAFSKRGFHTYCDTISREMWGLSDGESTAGDTDISLASQPSGDVRDKCLAFTTSGGAGTGFVETEFQYLPHGAVIESASLVTSFAEMWLRFRFLVSTATTPSSGQLSLVALRASGNTVYRLLLNANGTLDLETKPASSGSLTSAGTGSTAITYGQFFEVIIHIDQDSATATVKLKRDSDESYSTEISATSISTPAPVEGMRFGPSANTLSGNGSTTVYVDDFAVSDRQEADVANRFYIAGSGCRDVDSTSLAMALFVPDGLFGATHARVQYSTSSDFSSPSATALTAIGGKSSDVLPLTATGLIAGMRYYYRFQVSTSSSASDIAWTSDTYEARTLFITNPSGGKRAICVGSCADQNSISHPYDVEENLLTQVESDASNYLGFFHLGDQGYETVDFGISSLDPSPVPEDTGGFERQLRQFFADHAYEQITKAGVFVGLPDDHQFINDGDGRMRPGGALASTLANDWSAKQATYSASTTLSDLYTAGMTVFDDWFTDHWFSRPTAGERYKSWVDGNTRIVMVDTRTERNPSTPIMVSTTQLDWIKGQVDDFAANASELFLVFLCNGGWNTQNTKASEGWERVAAAQYYDLITYLDTNLPTTKRCVVLRGDDHAGYVVQQRHETASGVLSTNAGLGPECIFSGVMMTATTLTDPTGAGVLDRYPIATTGFPANGSPIRVSSGLITIDDTEDRLNAKSWSPEDDNLNYSIASFPEGDVESYNDLIGKGSHSVRLSTEVYYGLQETAGTAISDSSEKDRGGLLEGASNPATVTGPKTYLSSAISLDGTDDRIRIPGSVVVTGNNARTYAAWVNIPAFSSDSANVIFDLGGITGDNVGEGFVVIAEDGAISLACYGSRRITTKNDLATDTWYHIAIRIPDDATVTTDAEILIDGVNESTTLEAGSERTLDTPQPTYGYVGYQTSLNNYSAVKIAEFVAFSEALNDAAIVQLASGPEPLNTVAPAAPAGTAEVGETLTASTGTWDGQSNGTISYTYQWVRASDASGTNAVDISGATSNTYEIVSADSGKYIACRIRASNDGGFDAAEDTTSLYTSRVAIGLGTGDLRGRVARRATRSAVRRLCR